MRARRHLIRRTLTSIVVLAVTAGTGVMATGAPARAADVPAWETALRGAVADTATWTGGGLSRVGRLAQPLPLLGASPGALIEADSLVRAASDALTAYGLENADRDLGGGATLSSTVTADSAGHLLDLRMVARRQLDAQDLSVAGITAAKAVSITGWATLRLRVRATDAGEAYLVNDADAPRIDIDATAHFRPDLDRASASIGILEVALVPGGTTLDATTHLKVTVNDPDNDGKLAFGTGELGAAGSLAGLVQVGLDHAGGRVSDSDTGSGPGAFQASVNLGAAATGAPVALPDLSASITVDWPSIAAGSPQVSTTGLDGPVARFRNMSPLDLAGGVAQLATLIDGIQHSRGAGNLDLPLLKGTFADAVQVNEKLIAFLGRWVYPRPEDPTFVPGTDDPARAGQPKFISIQQLLRALSDEGLLAPAPVSFADDKLAFGLALSRQATEEVPLDPGADRVSGLGATFTPSGFTVPTARFTAHTLKGQRVVAGTSAGTVLDNTADTVTLEREWIGGRPPDDSTWTISSADPQIGAVALESALAMSRLDGKMVGLRGANAQLSLAKVKPSYTAAVTVVLDLRDGIGDAAANVNRVLLRTDPDTPLFTADFPITSLIEFYSRVGFLKVRLSGSLAVGPVNDGDAMFRLSFTRREDVSLGALFDRLRADPGGLLTAAASVQTTGRVSVAVPGDTGRLGDGAGIAFQMRAGDEPIVDTERLTALNYVDFDPDNPQALFAQFVEALRLVNAALADSGTGTGLLDQKIPLVGRSGRELLGSDESGVGAPVTYAADGSNFLLRDASRASGSAFAARLKDRTVVIGTRAYRVLDVVDGQTLRIAGAGAGTPENGAAYALRPELTEALDRLLANPPETLQDALAMVNGVVSAGSGLSFALDQRPGGPYLRVGLDWRRSFHTGGPIGLAWSGAGNLVSLDSSGVVSLDISAQANLGLLLPLSLDSAPLLDHSSAASVTVSAGADDVALAARVGPLALEIGKEGDFGKVAANVKFGLAVADETDETDKPVIEGLLGLRPVLGTDGADCGDGVGGADSILCARAPVFINQCQAPPGTNVLSFAVGSDFTVTSQLPDLGPCLESLALRLTDFNVGIDGYLSKLEDALRLASFDGKLPLVGDDLQQGQRFIHQLREDIKAAIGPVLANAPANSQGLHDVLVEALNGIDPDLTVTVTCQDGVAVPCPLTQLQSVRIQMDKGQGEPTKADGCANGCQDLSVPLDIGVPGLSLKAARGAADGVKVKLGWRLHLDMVLDRTEGFFIATHSGADPSPELQIGASFDTGGPTAADDLAAQLAFIQVNAHKTGTGPLVKAYFAIDLKGSPDEQSCFDPTGCTPDENARLTLSEFPELGSLIKTNLTAAVNIDWDLTARIDPSTEVGSALPGISTRFRLTWSVTNQTGELVPGDLDIGFSDVALDAGAFFTRILKPVVDKIKAVTGPLQPVIDTLYAPIPLLSDLSHAIGGPDITLLYLAKTFSTLRGGPNLEFVDTVRAVIDFARRIPDCSTNCRIPLGAFDVDPARALSTLASPAAAETLIKNPQPASDTAVKTAVDDASDGAKLFSSTDGESNADRIGFRFPVFDKPASLFGLLLGQDVELVSFDSGPLELGFTWRQSFGPVYAPPPIMVTLAGSASVSARFIAGLDTKGIRAAVEAATDGRAVSAVSLLDGLYFKTTDSSGKPVPVLTLRGEIAAGAQVSVGIFSAGVEGGVRLTVGFSWNDPNNDGKFRTSEFLQALLVNPVCLFTTRGTLSVFLRVYIKIDLGLFSKKWSFTLINATLLDFRAQPDCSPPPPELGGTVGDTLVVFAGRFGKSEQRRHAVWDNDRDTYSGDVFKIYALHYADAGQPGASDDFDGFAVESLGRRQEFLDPGLTRVVVDGRGYVPADMDRTAMSVVLLGDGNPDGSTSTPSSFDRTAVVMGSRGRDEIRTGTGRAFVDGGPGDDTIVTAEAAGVESWVAGGLGTDSITTGDGDDFVAGDSGLSPADRDVTVAGPPGSTTLHAAVNWDALHKPAADVDTGDGADSLTAGHGTNTVWGNAGDDTIAVMTDQTHPNGGNTLVGGAGADSISGGRGDDTIHTYAEGASSDVDSVGSGDAGLVNTVDTGGGQDTVYGSAGSDNVTSRSANGQTGRLYGYGGADVLVGGYGTDQVFGGPGEDWVIAEPSQVGAADGRDGYGPFHPVTHTPLPSGVQSQPKLLVGGADSDHILGGDGGATIFGDGYLTAEVCADNDHFGQVTPADQGAADLITGGAGPDIVSAGGGADRADLGGGADRACGQRGSDVLHLGGGDDRAWGGPDADQVYGDDGTDTLYGNEADDGLYGGAGADTVEGNDGADGVFGGDGDDVLYGGSRAAGSGDAGTDRLYGEDGQDRIVGDNGTGVDAGGPYPEDLSGAVTGAGAADVISGGPQRDLAYGGLGDDTVDGNTGDDWLEGNAGSDTIQGGPGSDEIIGGSSRAADPGSGTGWPDSGDRLRGDADHDLIAGDNAAFSAAPASRVTQGRPVPERAVTLHDLGFTPADGTGGADEISGGEGGDVIWGQAGTDRIRGDAGDDYAEGGPGSDWVEGDAGSDDLVGGSSTIHGGSGTGTTGQPDTADAIFGGPGSDAVVGDNGGVWRPLAGEAPTPATVRLDGGAPAAPVAARIVVLLDRSAADPARAGDDRISGGDGVDLLYGQDGADAVSGGGDADYVEGNGGADTLRGDAELTAAGHTAVAPLLADWPGAPGAPADLTGVSTPDGQDDMIGGSAAPAFRDGGDTIEGNGGDDAVLGDNGSLLRTIVDGRERVYTERYPTGADLAGATVVRTHDPALPGDSTRFCTTSQATCEPAGAYGQDSLFGDAGNDGVWGQDGDDVISGGPGDDDLYGELGGDTIHGDAGRDAILGDRGGVMSQYLNADDVAALGFSLTLDSVPQETFTGFRPGSYDRRVDLRHDTDGDTWLGAATAAAMPHAGLTEGGNDKLRGGPDADNIHAGYGSDLVNGDSGGDAIFGADGSDVLWGGKGCDPQLDADNPECRKDGVFDPSARGSRDQYVDHIFGGSGVSPDEAVESDVIDIRPRGSLAACVAGWWPVTDSAGNTQDPCLWFAWTDMADASTVDNQHHQGTDWIYGGWDRDAMQADVAGNGPNPGDRLMDWNGAYNLYTHCNAAYGGYNDIRQHSPSMQAFLWQVAWADGLGRSATDVSTPGTSAFRELAYTYPDDNTGHGAGRAYPGTPGHFDDPQSCTD